MDDLCANIENMNLCHGLGGRIYHLIMNDMKKLTEYYYIWKNEKEENIGFVIEPLPELDMYMDENFVDQLYDFLLRNDFGRTVFAQKIRSVNPLEEIDFRIFETLFQNYLDVLIEI
jgi:hypothetical protein